MRILAYLYSDPLLEPTPDVSLWGWEVDRVYQDQSLTSDKSRRGQRPQLQQLLQDAETEPADYLLIRRLEELGDAVEAVTACLERLAAIGLKLIVVEQSAPVGQAGVLVGTDVQANLLKLLQQFQREQQSRRIRQGHARNRLRAAPPPGKAPYGYRRSKNRYILDRTIAPVVKEFFDQFLLYGSLRGAVRYLEKRYGKKIAVSTGRRWLTNPVYRGDLEYQNGQVIPDTHPPIISREEAAQVDRLLRRNRRLPPRTASAPRSLAGLLCCQKCQSPMTVSRVTTARSARRGSRETQEYLYLRPTACPEKPRCGGIPYDKILATTIERICVDLPQAVNSLTLPDMDSVKARWEQAIVTKQEILAQLPDLVQRGILDQETADLRAYKVRTEIAELQNTLSQLPPVNLKALAQAVSIPQFWLDLSEAERRFYFREFIRQIELVREGKDWSLKLDFIF